MALLQHAPSSNSHSCTLLNAPLELRSPARTAAKNGHDMGIVRVVAALMIREIQHERILSKPDLGASRSPLRMAIGILKSRIAPGLYRGSFDGVRIVPTDSRLTDSRRTEVNAATLVSQRRSCDPVGPFNERNIDGGSAHLTDTDVFPPIRNQSLAAQDFFGRPPDRQL